MNDAEEFPGKKLLLDLNKVVARSEQTHAAATTRCKSMLDRMAAQQIVAKTMDRLEPKEMIETPAASPVSSRAAALATGLSSRATKLPSDAQIDAFIELNSRLGKAQRDYAEKWKPVSDLYESSGERKPTSEELQAVIAKNGSPAQYKSETENIANLVSAHKRQSDELFGHLATYRKANGTDEKVREVADKMKQSLEDLADQTGGSIPKADEAFIEDLSKTIRVLIEKMIELLKNLFGPGEEAKVAPK